LREHKFTYLLTYLLIGRTVPTTSRIIDGFETLTGTKSSPNKLRSVCLSIHLFRDVAVVTVVYEG